MPNRAVCVKKRVGPVAVGVFAGIGGKGGVSYRPEYMNVVFVFLFTQC